MRQRAVNVDLQPEIEEVCFNELASLCYDKTAKGEEILCLQDNLDKYVILNNINITYWKEEIWISFLFNNLELFLIKLFLLVIEIF